MSSGRSANFNHMYSYHSMGVMRSKTFILRVMKRSPGVDIVLLSNNLTVGISDVGVQQSQV